MTVSADSVTAHLRQSVQHRNVIGTRVRLCEDPMRASGGQGRVSLVDRKTSRRIEMTQFARPTSAAADYDSTIIGALELSEKKWVLAVQLPGVKRHSRHVVEARRDELA